MNSLSRPTGLQGMFVRSHPWRKASFALRTLRR